MCVCVCVYENVCVCVSVCVCMCVCVYLVPNKRLDDLRRLLNAGGAMTADRLVLIPTAPTKQAAIHANGQGVLPPGTDLLDRCALKRHHAGRL
jgi:hypothetical protein